MRRKRRSIYNQQPYQKKKKKKRSKLAKRMLGIFIIVTFCVLVVTGVRTLWNLLFNRYDLTEAVLTTWGNSFDCQALVLRDEFVDVSPLAGTIELQAEEGQLVQTGDNIASIVDAKLLSEKDEQLAQVEAQLQQVDEELQNCLTMQIDLTTSVKEQLRSYINQFVLSKSRYDLTGMNQAYKEIKESATKYQEVIIEDQKTIASREELQAKLDRLTLEREELFTPITAGIAGVVSYELDGLEKQFTEMTLPLADITSVWREAESSRVTTGDKVVKGQKLYKILGERWILITRVPLTALPLLTSSQEISCVWGDEILEGAVLHEQTVDDFGYLYFSMEDAPLLGVRLLQVTLQTEEKEGFEVPKTALRYENDQIFVYIKEDKISVKTAVEIVAENIDNVLVTGLKEGDLVIADANRLDD